MNSFSSSPDGNDQPWPAVRESYELIGKIGYGAFAVVWRARCETKDECCAIKVIDLENVDTNFVDIRLEVQSMCLSSHPNILTCHTSFVTESSLWIVTQFLSKGSSLRCIQAATKFGVGAACDRNNITESGYNDEEGGGGGMVEHHITYILYQTLLGLKYIHDNGQIHRDVKAGNILLGASGDVRIADFGVSKYLINCGNRRENTQTFVGTPCWMAPEVMEQISGYDYKADIWSLGITALELAKGYAPYAKYPPMKVLLMTIQQPPPSLDSYSDNDDDSKWSTSFRDIIKICLQKDPINRPTCEELLRHRHFRKLIGDAAVTARREQIKQELCDMIDDVGVESSGDQESRLNSDEHICVATRPAGTTWIFTDGSQVLASPIKSVENEYDDKDAFFDEFERQTRGEHFSSAAAAAEEEKARQIAAEDDRVNQAAAEDERVKQVAAEDEETKHKAGIEAERMRQIAFETEEERKKQSEKDELNQFFDDFENLTQGENFQRKDVL